MTKGTSTERERKYLTNKKCVKGDVRDRSHDKKFTVESG